MMVDIKTVAIIGGGMAGLAAARLLCKRGLEVRLFEANCKVGGCCATTQLGDYSFNDGALYLAIPGMLDRLFEALGLDRNRLLPLRRISAIQSTRLPDGTVVDIGSGPEITISAQGAAAASRLQGEVEDFLKAWGPTLRFFTDDIMVHPLSLPHLLIGGWRHLAKLRGTAASHLNSCFSSDAARAAFGGAMLYAGAPADKQPAASLLGLVSMLQDGYFIPEGGMGRIPEVLSEAVQTRGGSIHLDSAVRQILARNGAVCAIELENGVQVEVDAIISTVSAMHTYGSLLSESAVPARTRRRVRRTPLAHRGFVLQLGLANRIEARSHVNCVLPWLEKQAQFFETSGGDRRWSMYSVPTVTIPELAKNGGSIVEMFPSISQEMTPEDWNEERKEEVAAQAVELLRRDHDLDIVVSRILSPREFQDQTHLYAGALYGVSPTAGPGALFKHRTPIRGLYLAGQTTWPGFGVSGAGLSGVFAAKALLGDESL
jgi:phytoene dehydrogenase-like protein